MLYAAVVEPLPAGFAVAPARRVVLQQRVLADGAGVPAACILGRRGRVGSSRRCRLLPLHLDVVSRHNDLYNLVLRHTFRHTLRRSTRRRQLRRQCFR
eukprot:scaffold26254_cov59-Phaeocystis_antarctica.AAC.1